MICLERRTQDLGGIDPQTGEELGIGAGDPGRGLGEPVPIGVLADGDEDLANRSLDARQVNGVLDR
ncbi:hypothetical protein F4553_004621 [Allocatelliglobosispora scoriae]|uniref:Uncharacterized protein n=1 Tax=Allocatelliglobosispora scoriae TaxID=643052 RepID=A0A841BWU9_9ACTN|nr:hypothetical protein [Allocatelliglobosispora scoriae]